MTTSPLLKLRDYQSECIRKIHTTWDGGIFRPASVLPTGAGKTVIFSHLAEEYLIRNPGKRVIILSHTDELVLQTVSKMKSVAPHRTVGIVKAERNEVAAQVISASVQSLRSERRRSLIKDVGLIIVDEAHHAVANTYRTILEHYGALPTKEDLDYIGRLKSGETELPEGVSLEDIERAALPSCLAVGFTATLVRGDKEKLSDIWQEVAYQKDIAFMIRRGYLLDVKGRRVQVPDFDLSKVRQRGGDYADGALGDALHDALAPEIVAKAYTEHAADRKGLLFAPTVDSAYEFSDALNAQGIRSEVVHGGLARDVRRAILGRLRTGETQVICNCAVLTEGFDDPTVSAVVIARPTRSAGLYQQMVGRVLRPDLTLPVSERGHALVMDVVGVSRKHDLRSLVDLTSRQDRERLEDLPELEELSLLELEEVEIPEEGSGLGSMPVTYWAGPVETEDFDPLARDSERTWGKTPDGTYWLSAGQVLVFLAASRDGEPGTYDVVRCDKDPSGAAKMTEYRGLSFEMALSWGEEVATEIGGGTVLNRKGARWRGKPATDALKWKARREGVTGYPDNIKSGDLSELIDARIAAQRIDPLVRAVMSKRK